MGTRGKFWKVGPTIVLAVSVSVILLVVVIISLNMRTDRPTTRAGVIEEVLVDVDSIAATLPAGAVVSTSDASAGSACPDGSGGEEVAVSRTMTVGPDFDRYAWVDSVARHFDGLGWSVTEKTLDNRDHIALKLVGRQLLIYRVTVTDETGVPQVIIRSTTRCTEPATSTRTGENT